MSKLIKERWLRLAFANDSTTVITENVSEQEIEQLARQITGHFLEHIDCTPHWGGLICSVNNMVEEYPDDAQFRDLIDLWINVSEGRYECYFFNSRTPCLVSSTPEELISKLETFWNMCPFPNEDAVHAWTESNP